MARWLWIIGGADFLLGGRALDIFAEIGGRLAQADEESKAEPSPTPAFRQRLKWVLLAFVPSSLMLGVTTHISTDIASVPLLWVIPLALYLLTFIIVFARKPILPHSVMVVAMAFAVLLMPLMSVGDSLKFWMVVPIHLLTFFIIAMVCHGEMAPHAAGHEPPDGVLLSDERGRRFGRIVQLALGPADFSSTHWFGSVVEYPLMVVVACFLMPGSQDAEKRKAFDLKDYVWLIGLIVAIGLCVGLAVIVESMTWKSMDMKRILVLALLYGLPAIICFSFKGRPICFALGVAFLFLALDYYTRANTGDVLLVERNFFGVNRVRIGEIEKKRISHPGQRRYDPRLAGHVSGTDDRTDGLLLPVGAVGRRLRGVLRADAQAAGRSDRPRQRRHGGLCPARAEFHLL